MSKSMFYDRCSKVNYLDILKRDGETGYKKEEESSGRRSGRLILFIRLCQELYSNLDKTKFFGIQVNVRKELTFTFARMAAETRHVELFAGVVVFGKKGRRK